MPRPPPTSRFPVSLYATPNPVHQDVFYTVPRAGHLVGGPDHRVRRDHFPGHELLLCLRGRGYVAVGGRTHAVSAGDLVWINCHRPHEHGAVPADPWEVYWVRVEGPRLERLCEMLSVGSSPVFDRIDVRAAAAVYEELFARVADGAPESPALVHAAVARLIALAFCARQPASATPGEEAIVPERLRRAVERMRLFYFEPLSVADLAELAGLSPTHFSRTFKAAFGTSPIDWLRRERISQAKRRLAETDAAVQDVAEQVGYHDRFFFSKDFKRHTGLTPRAFRRREATGDRLPRGTGF